MALCFQELKGEVQYRDRRFEGTDEEYYRALDRSTTVYVGNLAFTTREEQLYEVRCHRHSPSGQQKVKRKRRHFRRSLAKLGQLSVFSWA